MKVAKSILFITTGLIALLAIGLLLFFKIRERQSQHQLVHRESAAILRVAVDEILWDVAKNVIKNPGFYVKEKDDKGQKDTVERAALHKLLVIPANLYFFSLPDDAWTWYVWLKVKDEQGLKNYLRDEVGLDESGITEGEDGWRAYTGDSRWSFAGHDEELLVRFRLNKSSPSLQLDNIWSSRSDGMVSVGSMAEFEELKEKAQLIWYNKKTEEKITANFENGKIISEAHIESYLWQFAASPKARKLPDENILNLYCHADLRPLIDRYGRQLMNSEAVSLDTIKQHYGGYLDLQWRKGDVMQQDTVIAYDYDENFDMIEKVDMKDVAVPNLELQLRLSPHIVSYLPQKMFYKFYQDRTGDLVQLRTGMQNPIILPFESQEKAFYLSYTKQPEASRLIDWLPYGDRMQRMVVKGRRENEHTSRFYVEIALERADIHPLSQIIMHESDLKLF